MAHYASLILFCITMCYIKPIIVAIKNAIKKDKTNTNNPSQIAPETENNSNK